MGKCPVFPVGGGGGSGSWVKLGELAVDGTISVGAETTVYKNYKLEADLADYDVIRLHFTGSYQGQGTNRTYAGGGYIYFADSSGSSFHHWMCGGFNTSGAKSGEIATSMLYGRVSNGDASSYYPMIHGGVSNPISPGSLTTMIVKVQYANLTLAGKISAWGMKFER